MERKHGRADSAPDVEDLLDDLYTTPPPEFVARRTELAASAKAAGRAEDARRIKAARRPTLAAWAANLLLRSRPEESRRFLELGQALREAYRTLDADGIKELSEQRRSIVSALSRQTAQLARAAGHHLSDSAQQDIQSTLRAVLADQAAADQWAAGRLENALTPPSTFASDTVPAADAPRKATERTAVPSSQTRARTKDDLADRRRRKRHEELVQARKAAKEAERQLRDKRAKEADADAAVQRARHLHDQARRQEAAAEQRLRQAREKLQRAEREQREAEKRRQAAADAVATSERTARAAADEAERLAASDG